MHRAGEHVCDLFFKVDVDDSFLLLHRLQTREGLYVKRGLVVHIWSSLFVSHLVGNRQRNERDADEEEHAPGVLGENPACPTRGLQLLHRKASPSVG